MQRKDLTQGNAPSPANADVATIVGNSDWANAIRQQIVCVARFSTGVLISGPSGTGKELIARAIHAHSDRAEKPFIPVDCTSFVSELFPSHMFGHVKGAFTGAEHGSQGCFRAADGGTVFLDEIGELEPHLQAKLLRVIEEKAVVPVGAAKPIPVNVRIIAATNQELSEEVEAGQFRKDLYYRLNIVELRTCPLKDRPDDIGLLANHFAAAFCAENGMPATTLCTMAIGALREHNWPGNVRELRNVLERALVFNQADVLTHKSLLPLLRDNRSVGDAPAPGGIRSADAPAVVTDRSQPAVHDAVSVCEGRVRDRSQWLSLAELERYHIEKTLEHTSHNQTAAAELLGISSRVLSRLIKEHGIDVSASRPGRPTKNRPRNRPPAD